MGLFDLFKKKKENATPANKAEFEQEVQELLARDDISGRQDICKAIYEKAERLVQEQTDESLHRAYDFMGNLASQFSYVPAILWMGDFAENVMNNLPQAASWYKKAADLGDGNGARNYADMLMTGRGIKKDVKAAIKYYALASSKGIPEASFVLGELFRNAGDKESAIMSYRLAADKGYAPAQERLKQIGVADTSFETQSASNGTPSLLTPAQFYNECLEDYHNTASQAGFAKRGYIFIPELIPIGEKTVLAFYQDPFFQMEFGNDPKTLYCVIMSLSLQAGMVFAEKWHTDFAHLNDAFVDRVIKEGPADLCKPLLKQLGLTDLEKENDFYRTIFERWMAMHEPYWKLRDPRQYTFKATLAAYQLGISMILEKYGY